MRRAGSGPLQWYVFFVLLFPDESLGFEGPEHVEITNLAWAIALDSLEPGSLERLAKAFDPNADAADFLNPGPGHDTATLGNLTEAVDCYQDPGRWALAPEGKNGLFSEAYFAQLRSRCDGVFGKAMALQTNYDHFQEGAASRYLDWHGGAIERAREGKLRQAVAHELVAQHYLQDFMAPGHLLADRENNLGTTSGDVHDTYNRLGASAAFAAVPAGGLSLDGRRLAAALRHVCVVKVDSSDLKAVAAGDEQLRLVGDRQLSKSENAMSGAAIVMVAARSMLEVLSPPPRESGHLALCFAPRLIERELLGAAQMLSPFHATLRAGYLGPAADLDGAERICDGGQTLLDVRDPNESGHPIGEYERLALLTFGLLHLDAGSDSGNAVEFGYYLRATRGTHWRQHNAPQVNVQYARYPAGASRRAITAIGFGGAYARWSHHDARSVTAEYWARPWALGPTDITLGLQVAASDLHSDRRSLRLPWAALKLGIGWSLVYLELGARREHVFVNPTEQKATTVALLGLKLAVTPQWIRRYVCNQDQ